MTTTPEKGLVMTVGIKTVQVLDMSRVSDADLGTVFALMVRFPSDAEHKLFVVAVDRGVATDYVLAVVEAPRSFETRGNTFNARLPFETGKYFIEGEPRTFSQLVVRSTEGHLYTVGQVQEIHLRLDSMAISA